MVMLRDGEIISDRFAFEGVDDPQHLRVQITHARDEERTALGREPQGGLA